MSFENNPRIVNFDRLSYILCYNRIFLDRYVFLLRLTLFHVVSNKTKCIAGEVSVLYIALRVCKVLCSGCCLPQALMDLNYIDLRAMYRTKFSNA